VGAAMAYLKNADGDLEAHNVVTGDIGRAYRPDDTGTVAVPAIISPTGIGVVEAEDRFYLSTPQGLEPVSVLVLHIGFRKVRFDQHLGGIGRWPLGTKH